MTTYNSQSQGTVLISTLNTYHLSAAIRKNAGLDKLRLENETEGKNDLKWLVENVQPENQTVTDLIAEARTRVA